MTINIHRSKIDRVLHSTDISLYEILPSGVVFPRNADEVGEILQYVNESNKYSKEATTVHSRGAGTSTAGQSLGQGLILDFTKHMNRILAVGENYVDVEPGVILGQLNAQLKTYGVVMPVDPSSAEVCSVGGMVANNSSGIHSYLYGDTKDYVQELEGYWADGTFFSTYTGKNTHRFIEKLKPLYSEAEGLKDRLPKTTKNSSGYNIKDAFFIPSYPKLIPLIVGSEGTLAVITKIRFKVIGIPRIRITVLSTFEDFEKSLKAVQLANNVKGISAIELLDKELIATAIKHFPETRKIFAHDDLTGLIFEIDGVQDFVDRQYKELETVLMDLTVKTEVAKEDKQREQLWWIRNAASSILSRIEGSTRSLRIIEDVAVPLDKIITFYNGEKKILDHYGLRTAFFGHIGSGHFHINPSIDTRAPNFIEIAEDITNKTYQLAIKLGGTLTAEHGDGILREPYIRKFQPELYELFLEIKKIFDPKWILNPGKIVNKTPSETAFKENIRYIFTPSKDIDAQMLNEVEKCHGCNECMTFCESYIHHGSNDEGYKSRGRANLVRAIVSGIITTEELFLALKYIDACHLCGKCFDSCPSGVDVIKAASMLRERGILPIRLRERLLMLLYLPYKKYLIWILRNSKPNSTVEICDFFDIFKLGLYYLPYLKEVSEIIRDKKLEIKTESEAFKMFFNRY